MESVTKVIATSILPIFLIISSGFLLSHWKEIDSGPLNTLSLFILNPALIVHSITLTELETDALVRVSLGVCLFVTAVLLASWVLGKALGKRDSLLYSFLLIATFGNTGALGIPLADFAFGDLGRQTAVLFAAVHGVLVFTIGLAIASNSGAQSRMGSLKRVFRYPLVYAVLLAIAARTVDIAPQADSAAMETLGVVYALTSAVFGAAFLYFAVRLHYEQTESAALRSFHASNAYLGALLLALVVDALVV